MGSTSPGPHSAWEQTSLVHWNGDEATDPMSLSSLRAYSWTRRMRVAKSFSFSLARPQIHHSQRREAGLHGALIPSSSHPAALLSPHAMMSPPLSQVESQICPQPLLGTLSFARPRAKHRRAKG